MLKLLISAVLVIAVSSILITLSSNSANSKIQELEKSKDRGKLSWYAARAKAKGQTEARVAVPILEYAVPKDLDTALAYYSLVVVEPVEKKSFPEESFIMSWYKFRLIEELSRATILCTTCPAIQPAPADMLPLKSDEFVASTAEGEIELAGVKLVAIDRDHPGFEKGKRYVIFLAFDTTRTVAALRMGPSGTFQLDDLDQLKAVNEKYKHPVIDELTGGADHSLNRLRRRLKTGK
jgi:hypothetical protein